MNNYSLRRIEKDDLQQVLTWRNSENIRRLMLSDSLISWAEHCHWFDRLQERDDCDFQIFCVDGQRVGTVSFSDIDRGNGRCRWGFYVGEEFSAGGYGSILAYHGLEYAFSQYTLHKIMAEVVDFNKKSLHFHSKLGFVETGLLKEHLLRAGKYVDVVLLSLFRRDWEVKKSQVLQAALEKIERRGVGDGK
ncbi:MAG TPA: UDP-4-amino-4,6-dideoxy-N-acetyl-beta-L-altrosamine N-acetyltransferase [Patescibacteria group bacterium]|nr:UDP-4-amino-4,6-dideoxy-N-acetyl-beta-L-altrosamine N-acetyltransferase [Patescibacteria group bacterium]